MEVLREDVVTEVVGVVAEQVAWMVEAALLAGVGVVAMAE